jgi:hypothetical protein
VPNYLEPITQLSEEAGLLEARGGGDFSCLKNYMACGELRIDENFEMIAVEVKAGTQDLLRKL